MKVYESVSQSVVSNSATPWTVAFQAPLSMGFSRKDTGAGCHFLPQGNLLTKGSNLGLLHCRQILYHLNHQGSLYIGIYVFILGLNPIIHTHTHTHTHMKVLVTLLCPILCNLMDCSSPRLLCPWDFPGKNTGVGSHSLLQEIVPTRGWNPSLPHCRQSRFFII